MQSRANRFGFRTGSWPQRGGSAGVDSAASEFLVRPYRQLLDEMYQRDLPLARLADESDLLLHVRGPAASGPTPRVSVVTRLLGGTRDQVTRLAKQLGGETTVRVPSSRRGQPQSRLLHGRRCGCVVDAQGGGLDRCRECARCRRRATRGAGEPLQRPRRTRHGGRCRSPALAIGAGRHHRDRSARPQHREARVADHRDPPPRPAPHGSAADRSCAWHSRPRPSLERCET